MKTTTRTRTSARILAGSIAALLAVQLAAPAVRAVDVTWDITPGTVGAGDSLITGGTGTWDPANVANGNWTTNAGVNNVAWNNAGNDTAVFGGASGTVTLASGATVGGLTFNNNAGYVVAGSTITFGSAGAITANVNAQLNSLLDANSLALTFAGTGNMTVSNAIANGTTLTKSGAGTLTLSGANTYTGGTTINAGTIATANFASLGSGTIAIGGSGTYAFSTTGNNAPTVANAVSGAGAFNVTGSGGNQSFWSGNFSGFSGTMSIGPAATLWARSSSNTGSTAMTVSLTGQIGLYDNEASITRTYNIGALTGSGNVFGQPGTSNAITMSVGALNTSTTFSGVIANNWASNATSTMGLTKVGSGTLTLTGAHTYTGATTVNGGVLQIGNAGNTGTLGTGNTTLTSPGSLTFNRTDAAYTYGGIISGGGSLTQAGTGTTTLSGVNTYSGGTTINAGTIATANFASLGSGTIAIGGSGTYAFSTTGGNQPTVANAVSGAGAFNVTGGGGNQSFWSGNFSGFSGTMSIGPVATLWARSSSNTGSTAMTLSVTGSLGLYDNEASITRTYNIGALTDSGQIFGQPSGFGPGGTGNAITVSVGALNTSTTFSGVIANNWLGNTSSTMGLTKVGSGTLTLTGANTYTGTTTISAGTINQGANNALGTGSAALTIAPTTGTGLYNMTGAFSQTVGLVTLGGAGGTTANITTGTGTLAMGGNLTYDATNNPNGATISGLLNLGTTQKTFTIGNSSAAADDVTVTAAVSNGGGGSILKTGLGTLTFAPLSVLAFDTLTTNDGTTNVNGVLGSGTAAVTVTDSGNGTKLRFGSVSQTLSSLTIGAGATVTFTSGTASGSFSGGGSGGKVASLGGSAVVPEPGTLGLLLVGALGVLGRRRRRA